MNILVNIYIDISTVEFFDKPADLSTVESDLLHCCSPVSRLSSASEFPKRTANWCSETPTSSLKHGNQQQISSTNCKIDSKEKSFKVKIHCLN